MHDILQKDMPQSRHQEMAVPEGMCIASLPFAERTWTFVDHRHLLFTLLTGQNTVYSPELSTFEPCGVVWSVAVGSVVCRFAPRDTLPRLSGLSTCHWQLKSLQHKIETLQASVKDKAEVGQAKILADKINELQRMNLLRDAGERSASLL